jgi:predicted RND superfamily exporter protein
MSTDHYRELTEELNIGYEEEHLKIIEIMNAEQRAGFDLIMNHVEKKVGQVFFVDGPGGTGKTYLYKALLEKVCSMNLIATATATSCIAASIMLGGRTAHSRFKIPIKLDNNTVCSFTK